MKIFRDGSLAQPGTPNLVFDSPATTPRIRDKAPAWAAKPKLPIHECGMEVLTVL